MTRAGAISREQTANRRSQHGRAIATSQLNDQEAPIERDLKVQRPGSAIASILTASEWSLQLERDRIWQYRNRNWMAWRDRGSSANDHVTSSHMGSTTKESLYIPFVGVHIDTWEKRAPHAKTLGHSTQLSWCTNTRVRTCFNRRTRS